MRYAQFENTTQLENVAHVKKETVTLDNRYLLSLPAVERVFLKMIMMQKLRAKYICNDDALPTKWTELMNHYRHR